MPSRSGLIALLMAIAACACNNTPATPALEPFTPTAPSAQPPAQPQELVRGWITDTAWREIAGVQIEVLDGPQAGTSTFTDGAGSFTLPGVFDDGVRFRVRKEGYVEAIVTSRAPACATCARSLYLSLESPTPSAASLTGEFDLTVVAADTCSGIPAAFRSRTYVATISQAPASQWQYVGTVTGPTIVTGHSWEGIGIGTTPDHVTITIGNAHGDPGLLEQVDASSYLSFDGSASIATGPTPAGSLDGAFDGFIDYCVLPAGSPSPVTTGSYVCGARPGPSLAAGTRTHCQAKTHRLLLTRR